MPRRMKKFELGSLYLKAQNCRFDIEAVRTILNQELKPLIIGDEAAMDAWRDAFIFTLRLCGYLRETTEALRYAYNDAQGHPHPEFGRKIECQPAPKLGD